MKNEREIWVGRDLKINWAHTYKDGCFWYRLGKSTLHTYKDGSFWNRRGKSSGTILKTVLFGTVVVSSSYLQNCHRVFYNDGYFSSSSFVVVNEAFCTSVY